MSGNLQELHNFRRALSDVAEQRWIRSLACKVLAVIFGVVVVVLKLIPEIAPFITVLLSLASFWFAQKSSQIRGIAESLLRKLELADGVGWEISGREIADVRVIAPKSVEKFLPAYTNEEKFFASQEGVGPKRAIENTQESAWWSKHLARRAEQIYSGATWVIVVLSIGLLIVSMNMITNTAQLSDIARVATSILVFTLSGGIWQLGKGYASFSRKAEQIESRAAQLLEGRPTEVQAVKLIAEYQLARATAPLLPSWLYKSMRNKLNSLWEESRKR